MTGQYAIRELEEARLQRSTGAGRLSVIHLDGKTSLKTLYQKGCAKLRIPGHQSRESMEAVMINTSGGMTGGDDLSWEFDAGPGTALSITTQASEKIYRSAGGAAEVRISVKTGMGTRFSWLPQETILFDRCNLSRTIHAELSSTCRALFVEPVVFGRAAMGETVATGSVRDRWRIFLDGALLHAEDFLIDGTIAGTMQQAGVTGGAGAFATVLLISPDAEDFVDRARDIVGEAGGVSAWCGKLLIRIVSPGGYELRQKLAPVIGLLEPETAVPKLWTF